MRWYISYISIYNFRTTGLSIILLIVSEQHKHLFWIPAYLSLLWNCHSFATIDFLVMKINTGRVTNRLKRTARDVVVTPLPLSPSLTCTPSSASWAVFTACYPTGVYVMCYRLVKYLSSLLCKLGMASFLFSLSHKAWSVFSFNSIHQLSAAVYRCEAFRHDILW